MVLLASNNTTGTSSNMFFSAWNYASYIAGENLRNRAWKFQKEGLGSWHMGFICAKLSFLRQ